MFSKLLYALLKKIMISYLRYKNVMSKTDLGTCPEYWRTCMFLLNLEKDKPPDHSSLSAILETLKIEKWAKLLKDDISKR